MVPAAAIVWSLVVSAKLIESPCIPESVVQLCALMNAFGRELRSQPDCWRRTATVASAVADMLPKDGQRVCVLGCGTSLYMGQAYAAFRESANGGETDAFPASEAPRSRRYDLVVALSRSGTTTEVLDAVTDIRQRIGSPVLAITSSLGSPLAEVANTHIVLDFADEVAIVQTRFATSALLLLLSGCGWDIQASASDAEVVLGEGPPNIPDADQYVFVGRGIAAPIASEAALKLRESAKAWSEAYPSMEFRHGPISAVGTRTVVWSIDPIEPSLSYQIEATGASVISGRADSIAELVRVHLVAEQLAKAAGFDPDTPDHLTRSVILTP